MAEEKIVGDWYVVPERHVRERGVGRPKSPFSCSSGMTEDFLKSVRTVLDGLKDMSKKDPRIMECIDVGLWKFWELNGYQYTDEDVEIAKEKASKIYGKVKNCAWNLNEWLREKRGGSKEPHPTERRYNVHVGIRRILKGNPEIGKKYPSPGVYLRLCDLEYALKTGIARAPPGVLSKILGK